MVALVINQPRQLLNHAFAPHALGDRTPNECEAENRRSTRRLNPTVSETGGSSELQGRHKNSDHGYRPWYAGPMGAPAVEQLGRLSDADLRRLRERLEALGYNWELLSVAPRQLELLARPMARWELRRRGDAAGRLGLSSAMGTASKRRH